MLFSQFAKIRGVLSLRSRRRGREAEVIQHVTRALEPALLEDCASFYRLFGFVEVPAPPGIAGRALWLEHPRHGSSAQLHLMPREGAAPDPGHFALVVEDYAATTERLRAAGHEVDARREHWGAPRCYVRDPAGNTVELMAWGPDSSAGG